MKRWTSFVHGLGESIWYATHMQVTQKWGELFFFVVISRFYIAYREKRTWRFLGLVFFLLKCSSLCLLWPRLDLIHLSTMYYIVHSKVTDQVCKRKWLKYKSIPTSEYLQKIQSYYARTLKHSCNIFIFVTHPANIKKNRICKRRKTINVVGT